MSVFYKTFSKVIFLTICCAGLAYGEREEYKIPDDPALIQGPDTMILLEDIKSKKGWSQTKVTRKDGSTMLVVSGVGQILAPQTSPNYVNSRQNAFDKAMLQAKKALVEHMALEIGGELSSYFEEPSDKRQEEELINRQREGLMLEAAKDVAKAGAEDAGILSKLKIGKVASDKAKDLLVHEVNLELRELGYDPNEPVDQQTLQKITQSEKFKKSIAAVAKSRVVGLQPYKIIENSKGGDQGQIGVIAVWSPKLNAVANAIYSNDMSFIPKSGKGKKSFVEQIPTDTKVLLTTFGARQFIGPDGGYGVMAFAQVSPKSNNSRSVSAAYGRAKLAASFMVRQFAGEVASVQVEAGDDESMTNYADGMAAYTYDNSYSEAIKAKAESISIPGLQTIKMWKGIHPINNAPVVGAVVLWTPEDNLSAQSLKKTMNTVPQRKSTPAAAPGQTTTGKPFDGGYDSASDDADEDAF